MQNKIYQPEIDGLRALAVIAVILNHFSKQILPSGHLGVDIFFVISGFVITSTLTHLSSDNLFAFLFEFYSKRVRRLVPALILCVGITGFLICLVNPNPWSSLQTGRAALFGFSNFSLLKLKTNYFAEATELNVFTQTWSLGVEEQFYLFFPALAFLTGFARSSAKGTKVFLGLLFLLWLLSVGGFFYLGGSLKAESFYLMPTRFWEIGTGCLLFLLQKHAKRLPISPIASFLFLVATLFAPLEYSAFTTMANVFLTALLIPNLGRLSFFKNPIAVYVGQISYSLYLWHWSVLSLSRWTIGIHWWTVPIQVVLMFSLAMASYHFVERPLRYRQWSKANLVSISYAVGALAVAFGVVTIMNKQARFLSLDFRFPSALFQRTIASKRNVGKEEDKGCQVAHKATREQMEKCLLSGAKGSRKLFIFGDSHADHYVEALKGALPDWTVRSFTAGWRCGYISKKDTVPAPPVTFKCSEYVDLVDEFLTRHLGPNDIVLVAHRWFEKKNQPHLNEALLRLAEMASGKTAHVILIDDVAELEVNNVLLCERRPWRPSPNQSCYKTRQRVLDDQKEYDALRETIANGRSNVHSLSLRTLYCETDGVCGPTLGETPVYSDGSHLDPEASRIGAQAIAEFISTKLSLAQ